MTVSALAHACEQVVHFQESLPFIALELTALIEVIHVRLIWLAPPNRHE